jgi:hypothetical protein
MPPLVRSVNINATWAGHVVTLKFSVSLTVTDGGNLLLPANFNATADDTLTLVCDGTNFEQLSSATN